MHSNFTIGDVLLYEALRKLLQGEEMVIKDLTEKTGMSFSSLEVNQYFSYDSCHPCMLYVKTSPTQYTQVLSKGLGHEFDMMDHTTTVYQVFIAEVSIKRY